MAKLDISQIEHIAKLSKLALTSEEKELYSEQLTSVLNYVDQLSEVNTEKVEPLSNVTGLKNVFRDDQIEESNVSYQDIMTNAPKFENGSFEVPGVFE